MPSVAVSGADAVTGPAAAAAPMPRSPSEKAAQSPSAFVNRLWPHAAEASRETGIASHFHHRPRCAGKRLGKAEIRTADCAPGHNLFGIKAGRGWKGPVAETTTTEYVVNGVAYKTVERFRAYPSYAEAFKDYAALLRGNPRYAAVIEGGRDRRPLPTGCSRQAMPPIRCAYADKLSRILQGNTLRQSLVG